MSRITKNKTRAAQFAEAVHAVCGEYGFTIVTYKGQPGLHVIEADAHCDIDFFLKDMICSIHYGSCGEMLPGELSEDMVKFAEEEGI